MTQKKLNVKERLNNDGEIDLSMLEIQDVPVREIALLKKATILNLYNNNISKLPDSFSSLTHLVKLDLSKNCLKELPENFGDLVRLKHLDLYQNQLVRLPLSFSKLKSLKWLDLKENRLEPTLYKVAGPCENTKQCQVCARNIINYLTRQQNRADLEKEEKEKQKRKQLELNENKKKEEKKTKKKQISEMPKNGTVHVLTKTEKKKLKKLKKQSDVTSSTRYSSILIIPLLLISLFILTSLNVRYLDKLENIIVNSYFKCISMLPNDYQTYGNIFAQHFKRVHVFTGEMILNLIHFLQNNEQCCLVYSFLNQTVTNISVKVSSMYRSIMP
ncbi:hypothetical protein WA026_013057 [Henosepilachna vigintioctopunctata]|uniref:Leucine-rich repeat protein soc-2 homolog n=1 Tax=Henosepilachna vigintioctopunctata TaxID=420089 RepID=A0AAW1UDK0_9CUCU